MKGLTLCSVLFLFSYSQAAADFLGSVVFVLDGDTTEVLHNNRTERIRLNGIDCPSYSQVAPHNRVAFNSAVEAKQSRSGTRSGYALYASQSIQYLGNVMRSYVILLLSLTMITPVFAAPQEIEIPKASWEPIFFDSINRKSEKARWTPLRQMDIPNDAIEVRVWIGFGLSGLEGLLLRRNGDQWLGLYTRNGFKVHEVHPEAGWNALWKRVEALGILTLPDSSTLPGEAMVDDLDGISYVVEINDGKLYRTYHYSNPQGREWPEAEKITEIVKTLYSELVKKK